MQNQTDFDRVNTCMIAPLCVLFNQRLADEVVDGFVDELRSYSDDVLRSAFKFLRRTVTRMPPIAKAIEACEEVKSKMPSASPASSKPSDDRFHCQGHAEQFHRSSATEILSSPAGRLALEMGVARDLMVEYEKTGRRDFDEAFVKRCKRGLEKATTELVNLPIDSQLGKSLHALFASMQEREKRLFMQFSTKIEYEIAA